MDKMFQDQGHMTQLFQIKNRIHNIKLERQLEINGVKKVQNKYLGPDHIIQIFLIGPDHPQSEWAQIKENHLPKQEEKPLVPELMTIHSEQ